MFWAVGEVFDLVGIVLKVVKLEIRAMQIGFDGSFAVVFTAGLNCRLVYFGCISFLMTVVPVGREGS